MPLGKSQVFQGDDGRMDSDDFLSDNLNQPLFRVQDSADSFDAKLNSFERNKFQLGKQQVQNQQSSNNIKGKTEVQTKSLQANSLNEFKDESLSRYSKLSLIEESMFSNIEQSQSIIRLRPTINKETSNVIEIKDGEIWDGLRDKVLKTDERVRIFTEQQTTEQIYNDIKLDKQLYQSIDNGQNLSIFCFGHTDSGKSYTMFGNRDKNPGLLPLILESIFAYVYGKIDTEFLIRVAYIEIHHEQMHDLLSPNTSRAAGSFIERITEEICFNIDQVYSLIRMGDINRQIGTKKLNERAAHSHIVIRLTIESFCYSCEPSDKLPLSTINLVDLAGSELLNEYDDHNRNSFQTNFLTKSLVTLEQILAIQSEGCESDWVPFKESKLTRLLSKELEGNSHNIWIFNISPSDEQYRNNKKTIEVANKVPSISLGIKSNYIKIDDSMLFKVKKRINALKQQLARVELMIQQKEQYISQKSNRLTQKSISSSIEQDLDERIKLLNEIKKYQNQILVCDRVGQFMKKFDKKRTSVTKRNSLQHERLSQKIDSAREHIIQSDAMPSNNSRKTLIEPSETYKRMTFTQDKGAYQIGRLTILEKMLEEENKPNTTLKKENSISFGQDSNLLDDDNDLEQNLALLSNPSEVIFEKQNSIQTKESKRSIKLGGRNSKFDNESEIEEPQDDEELDSDQEDFNNDIDNQDKDDNDLFYAIQEEEDEEDSFEKERRTKREILQKDYERKLDEMEKRLTLSATNNKTIRSKLDNNDSSNNDNQEELKEDDDDEDLLKNFEGIPKISIIEMLDQHRQSIVGRKSQLNQPQSNKIENQQQQLRSSLHEADTHFLEALLIQKDIEIEDLKSKLKLSDIENQKLRKDSEQMQIRMQLLEKQLKDLQLSQ